ncbi:MAG: methionine--tRNA ligase [Chloroflexota bacterium]|nr:methionine--tRNA ligase [Chloroflexota bacterium]
MTATTTDAANGGEKENILVCVAWPYASGARHVGHMAAYIPSDVFARYHRMKGNNVLMVSGSDQHGTPVTLVADREGKTPEEVARYYHGVIKDGFDRMGMIWECYTETHTDNHIAVTQSVFNSLLNAGYLFTQTTDQMFDPVANRFLPDRYVEGTCPICGYADARGDQCDNCGNTLDPVDLINPRSKLTQATPELRATEHFFFDLPQFSERLLAWIETHDNWRPNVRRFTENWVREGLKPRAITRDLDWGVPIPVPGFAEKRIYVWFDAVIGYLSASIEWANRQGNPEAWRQWWTLDKAGNAPSKAFYFIGKDNVPFHTIIWPAILLGVGGLTLPYDVPAVEYMLLNDQKISTSRGIVITLPDYLSRYDPDPLRYFVIASSPEARDTSFTWSEFFRRNNDELVATYGNLVNRVLSLTQRYGGGAVPEPGPLDDDDREMLARARAAFPTIGTMIEGVHLKDAINATMALAAEFNRYLERKKPWETGKTDTERTNTTLFVALQGLNALRVLTAPFIPFSAQQVHEMLGYTGGDPNGANGGVADEAWAYDDLEPGRALPKPKPLFRKLDDTQLAEEIERLRATFGEG